MSSAEGRIDAIVEKFEVVVTMLNAAWNKEETKKYASVSFAIDAVSVNEAYTWGFHKYGYFAPVRLAFAEDDVVYPCLWAESGVLCGVADVVSVDGECAVASNFAHMRADEDATLHNLL